MNARGSFVVYHSKLYTHARKNFREPVQNEQSFPNMSGLKVAGVSWTERVSFVVEWEVNKPELTHTGQKPSRDDNLSFIIDW